MPGQVHHVEGVLGLASETEERGIVVLRGSTLEVWAQLADVLVPVIGPRGMVALYNRVLELAAERHPWFEQARSADMDLESLFSLLGMSIARQDVDEAAAAIACLFDTFDRVLVTLVGAPLSARLLQPIWERASAGARPRQASDIHPSRDRAPPPVAPHQARSLEVVPVPTPVTALELSPT